ncbi:LysR family transcriptional regulator [Rhizobium subbaraonis]|uniref:HTH-type transcriptional regulator TtuA n=1 Tax=Rhizobium subbaraonis TaxID=908946 RepID=A0A285UW18_9HYPH|nr:LysR family transcriptional regulator [Rhizobium subbaraonis]
MQDLNDLALFAAVVKHRGFTAAANALGVPKSKISKRVAQLEEQLGVRLLERSTRKLRVTDIGQTFYERCETILAGVDAAEAVIAAAKSEPAGPVRLAMPPGFAPILANILPTFLKRFPDIRLAILMTNRPVDLIEERVDVALRVRASYDGDQSIVVRKFGDTRQLLAASPAFIARHGPITFENLAQMPTIAMQENPGRAIWTLVDDAGAFRDVAHNPVLSCIDSASSNAQRSKVSASGCCRTPSPKEVSAPACSPPFSPDGVPRSRACMPPSPPVTECCRRSAP